MQALKAPGKTFKVGRLKYYSVENILNKPQTLFCELPSGRVLTYPDVVAKVVDGKYGPTMQISALRAAWSPKTGETEWPRGKLYGGLLFENAVQGTAADLLREGVAESEHDGLEVVFHVHDELVLEVPAWQGEDAKVELEDFMDVQPWWAKARPIPRRRRYLHPRSTNYLPQRRH